MLPSHPIHGAPGAKMETYTAHYQLPDGSVRRFALTAWDRDDARREALLLGRSMFPRFTYCVRPA